ncbi:penicillin-binding protein activator [Pseudoduganella sp. SL102]|uniref:penicillin-binding protein activator n=1 Tax=Pseudoduganella sp. SL102 TaxID=2995154 RepID=UPI00248CE5C5|nr:penicillin-binding protein activator [Pseudoduganella sp. SL102]WBS02948.1 penicillin-binding protein activator [Pseudoduganella sp. SL102]
MLANKIKTLLSCVVAALSVSACSTPCGSPGALCAPIETVTSPPPRTTAPPAPKPAPPPEETAQVETFAVAMPGTTPESQGAAAVPGQTVRIGLVLPLRSESLGRAADAVRAGFMAAWERDRAGFEVTVVETGDAAEEILSTYQSTVAQQDIIVGPLARSAVTTLAASPLVTKPTIALNHPEDREGTTLPPQMLSIGLSIEEEARQVAEWAAREHPAASVMILSGSAAWQRRIANAFATHAPQVGMTTKTLELTALNGYLSDGEMVALRARLAEQPVDLLFAALDADQTRQLRTALAAPPLGDIPLYGTSSLNPGRVSLYQGPELDGVKLLDLPWQIQRDNPTVASYPQPAPRDEERLSADMERLYALGIDAFRVAREIAVRPGQPITLDGVTGQLSIDFGNGPARVRRVEPAAIYRNGVPVPITTP